MQNVNILKMLVVFKEVYELHFITIQVFLATGENCQETPRKCNYTSQYLTKNHPIKPQYYL